MKYLKLYESNRLSTIDVMDSARKILNELKLSYGPYLGYRQIDTPCVVGISIKEGNFISHFKTKRDMKNFMEKFKLKYSNDMFVDGNKLTINIDSGQINYFENISDDIDSYLTEFRDMGYYINIQYGNGEYVSHSHEKDKHITSMEISMRIEKESDDDEGR